LTTFLLNCANISAMKKSSSLRARSFFTSAGTLNTAVRLDTDRDGEYRKKLACATASVSAAA
jgi:hypothetical protein